MIAILLVVLIILVGAVIFVINNSSQVNKNSIQTTAQAPPVSSPQTKSTVSLPSTPSVTPSAPPTSILRTGSPIAIKAINTSNENADADASKELLVSLVLVDDNGQSVTANGTVSYIFSYQPSPFSATEYQVLTKQRVITDTKSDSPFILQREDFQGLRCPVCSGTGKAICTECNGTGHESCALCDGKGYLNCSLCDGTGKYECSICNGTGSYFSSFQGRQITCVVCNGTGKMKCPLCSGTGKAKCSLCKGAGQYICPICNGSGKKSCSVLWCRNGLLDLAGVGVSLHVKFMRANGVILEAQKTLL